jgi:RNA polymerase sigma-70 factor (ECF subfamily)
MDGLLALLANEAVAWADGGGKFSAARRPVVGANRVARFVTGVLGKWRSAGQVEVAPVNGGVGLLHRVGGRLRGVMTVSTNAGRIHSVFIMVNPEKLRAAPSRADTP